jgi:hypothetical protein
MPTIKDWKKQNKELLEDIEEYEKEPDLISPYRILSGVASVLIVSADFLIPQVGALKWMGKGILLLGKFFKGYSARKLNA